MLSDCHVHTSFSGDSDTPPEVQIERAIELGLKYICFTDHHDHDVVSDICFELDIDSYFEKMTALREKYRDSIDIGIGIELGLQVHLADYLTNLVKKYPFDYVIGSVHFIDGLDPYYPKYFFGRSEREAYERYFSAVLENISSMSCYDSLGHLDYIVRYGPNKNRDFSFNSYKEYIIPVLQRLIADGKALECNSGGYAAGLGNPNPCCEILTEYYRLGGRLVTIGSDAHTPERMAYCFDDTADVLIKSGFDKYACYHNRKPKLIHI